MISSFIAASQWMKPPYALALFAVVVAAKPPHIIVLLSDDLAMLLLLQDERLEDAFERQQLARWLVTAHEDIGEGSGTQKAKGCQ